MYYLFASIGIIGLFGAVHLGFVFYYHVRKAAAGDSRFDSHLVFATAHLDRFVRQAAITLALVAFALMANVDRSWIFLAVGLLTVGTILQSYEFTSSRLARVLSLVGQLFAIAATVLLSTKLILFWT